jgi:hypothetical protein
MTLLYFTDFPCPVSLFFRIPEPQRHVAVDVRPPFFKPPNIPSEFPTTGILKSTMHF